jgi:N-acetylmuramoyl-L-alanine amidase-like protein
VTQVIAHSAVGSGSLYEYFKQTGVVLESHFWVGLDGRVEQYIDTSRQADANYHANVRAMSIESADNGDPDHFEWTEAQQQSIAELMSWAHEVHGVPLRRCPTWDSPGVGYHTMFGAPSDWTPVSKSCPGTARKAQFNSVVARAVAISQGEDVALTQAEIDAVATKSRDMMLAALIAKTTPSEEDAGGNVSFKTAVENIRRWSNMALTAVGADAPDIDQIKSDVTLIKASLAALVAQGPPDVDEAAIVAGLTPVLQGLNQLNDESLSEIATAVNDELARRAAS